MVLKLSFFLAIVVAVLVYFTPRSPQLPPSQQQQAAVLQQQAAARQPEAAPPPSVSVNVAERMQAEKQLAEQARLVAFEAAGRGAFPDRMEQRFRDEFRAVTFGVSGENNTVLTMRQPQAAASFTYKVGPWIDFLESCRAAGFRQVVVIDGNRSTRTFELTPAGNPRPASPAPGKSTG